MAKRPVAGRAKTRLCPPLSPEQAAELYEAMLRDTVDRLSKRVDCNVLLAVDESASLPWFEQMWPHIPRILQTGTTLGERLDAVIAEGLKADYSEVFAVGSDSPDLPAGHLSDAFLALAQDEHDLVLGPTADGGYYLIGATARPRSVVTDVVMSTPTVLADTLAIARSLNLRVHLAPAWHDIDTADDLERLRSALCVELAHTSSALARLNVGGVT